MPEGPSQFKNSGAQDIDERNLPENDGSKPFIKFLNLN